MSVKQTAWFLFSKPYPDSEELRCFWFNKPTVNNLKKLINIPIKEINKLLKQQTIMIENCEWYLSKIESDTFIHD